VSGLCGRDGPAVGEWRGTGAAPTWVRLGGVTSSDPMSGVVSGSRRRARAEAARSESVWVRLSPDEAAVVGAAAARAGMSVGAWVGETAVGRARVEAAGDEPAEARGVGVGSSSWRELVAALVALRAEVAALRRLSVAEPAPASPAGELLDDKHTYRGPDGADRNGVVGVLRRIDVVTAAAVEAALSPARRWSRAGRERPGRS
jgi:uncharacterized protein (DUF1778 family)